MNDPTDRSADPADATFVDRARALLDGSLAPEDALALRREIAADPALRAEFDGIRDVFAMTAAEPAIPASSLTADTVLVRAAADGGRVINMRRRAVAAAVLLAAVAIGVAANFALRPPEPRDVTLAALCASIPVPVPTPRFDPRPPADPLPARLADFRPVRDGKPAWLDSYDEGKALSRESGKPMLVWVYHPECPMCVQLDRESFADAGVQRDLEAFVPVRVDVMHLDPASELGRTFGPAFERGAWPYFVALDADGATLASIQGAWEISDVRPKLDAAAKSAEETARPTWEQIRTAATDLGKAEEAVRANRLGDAVGALRRARESLPAPVQGRPLLPIQARAMNFPLPIDAQRVLEQAAASVDPAASLPSLDAAARAFAGSSVGNDLAAVARAIRETGRFPRLHDRLETR